ncbi:MAG: 2-amino-4-hydroxy-6-hydroxymethyldihydropteridine diphosphokinase [Gammaproteobacteria bacterium]|nr:2-amino-4-hydroxy-6-hydroxymethyldihydropteridine diphosphokinase [Gammaproteobacteria bacterium]
MSARGWEGGLDPEGWVRVYVGLGSNLDDPVAQLRRAREALERLPATGLAARSALYRNPPMGPPGQPDYVNAVVALDTGLGPHELLDLLQAIEAQQGRVRGAERWGPRTLDLDILMYGDAVLEDERLTIPHPGLQQRPFVLYPLRDIAPELEVPGGGAVSALAARCPSGALERLEDAW